MTPTTDAQTPWAGELAAAHKDLERLRQEVNAMRYILDSLVIAHHNPGDLLQLWRMLQPGLIDELIGPRRVAEPETQGEYAPTLAGWHDVMRRYTSLLESTLDLQDDEDESEPDVRS
ncbi:MAG TPA: hypothetical protein VJ806_09320 [Luteimonas sp.]|nr:hypothetical protein [Luteimonas sp.]